MVYYIVGLFIMGLGAAFFVSPNTNAVMSSVKKKYYGIAASVVGTMRHIGAVFSMGIIMILFSIYMGRVQITPEYYGSFQESFKIIFLISAAIAFCGIFVSLARGNLDNVEDEDNNDV